MANLGRPKVTGEMLKDWPPLEDEECDRRRPELSTDLICFNSIVAE